METFFSSLKSNWFLVIFIGSLIIGWTTFSVRLGAVEALAQDNKTTLDIVQDIKLDIARIQKDVEFIKEQVQ